MLYGNIILFPIQRTNRFMSERDKIIKNHVLKETKDSFSKKVESIVWEKDISYLEAISDIADKQQIEPERVGKLLTKDLYAKLEKEAEQLSLLKTKKNRLM